MQSRTIALITLQLAAVNLAAAQSSSVLINEICPSNIDQWVDPSFNYGGWVEIYNPTSTTVYLTGWYLSDTKDKLQKAKINQSTYIPAKGYATLWFDHYSKWSTKTIDMKLDCDGGTLYLSDASGNLVASADYPEAVSRCSWARTSDGGETWNYCAAPTPRKTNAGSPFASERLEAPEVNLQSQTFASGTINVQVTIPEGCTLRYTTDGSAPTERNGNISITGNFATTVTRMFRFRLFRDGYLPSPVVTRTFIRSTHDIDLPILSIYGTQANFYGDSLGIFVKGVNGRPGNGQSSKCNWNMDWERPSVFEFFSADGTLLFAQEAGIERCGGWSRAWSPASFKIKANKRYEGHKNLLYPFFDEKPYLKHKTLQVRNGGNDNGCRVKDPILQQIVATSGIDIDYQAYQPIAHFINGVWKGAINLREPNNKHFVYANYGYDDTEIDQFEMSPDSGYCQKCGTYEAMQRLLTLSKTASNDDSYREICDLLDMDEFCNYMAIEFYIRNSDWPQNNMKAWRPRFEGGKFRFILYDLDAFDWTDSPFYTFANKQTYRFDHLYGESTANITKEIEMVTVFLNLLNNDTFRKKFIDTFCLVAYSVFEPSRCAEICNAIANRVAHTQSLYNNESPWWTANDLRSSLSSSRQTTLMNLLKSYSRMKLSSQTTRTATLQANIREARLSFNGMPIPTGKFSGQYYAPLAVKAEAPSGYRFTGWRITSNTTVELFPTSQTWRYYDKGTLDDTQWNQPDYNDSQWASGGAPLGYFVGGNRYYKTTLGYGNNENNKYPTYYFRTSFNLDEAPTGTETFRLSFTVDDGMVVYINGVEATRYNMPGGTVTYNTYATSYAPNNPDSGTADLDPALFRKGENIIAVEVHNNLPNSTDIYWSASLSRRISTGGPLVTTQPEYTLIAGSSDLIACFEPITSSEANLAPIVINEVSADNGIYINDFQKKADWIELYNTTSADIDLTGIYLSNDLTEPEKWRIGSDLTAESSISTIIPAHGYRIIWCDKEEGLTDLHAPFKLSNEDQSHLVLTAADDSWSDTLTYCAHLSTETVGRYPDASRNVYRLTRTTIEKTNQLTCYSSPVEQPAPEAIRQILPDEVFADEYTIYDMSGRLVATGHGPLRQDLISGAYIVRSKTTAYKLLVP